MAAVTAPAAGSVANRTQSAAHRLTLTVDAGPCPGSTTPGADLTGATDKTIQARAMAAVKAYFAQITL